MIKRALATVVVLMAGSLCQNVLAQTDEHFDIKRFAVEGNSLLSAEKIDELVAPFTGKDKAYGDIRRALEALEAAYRAAGFNTIRIYVPEQELSQGVVKLAISEGAIGKATDSKSFSEANERSTLPEQKEGEAPNARPLAENTRLSNDNPATQVEATPGVDEEEKNLSVQAEVHFDISRIVVEGNSLLPAEKIDELVAPFTGKHRVYGDIQHALEALETAYRAGGYNTVQVYVPEQELSQGVVKLAVTEGVIGKVKVTGNKYFSEANVRAALPALIEGVAPNTRRLSENIQLSNDNPAKQVEVTLGVGEEENKIDARVAVTDDDPQKIITTLDNTGTDATGKHRIGLAYQNANLFQLDHMMTLAYTTAPDAPQGVKVDIYSVAYRLPLYQLGDSIDVIYGNSNVNTPTVQATGFGMVGKGDVTSMRFNHYFPRQGEFSSKLAFGFDYKYFNTRCSIGGIPQAIDPPLPALASCTPYTTRPLNATYSGQWQTAGTVADYNLGIAYNSPLGSRYLFKGGFDHYSLIANRPVSDNFTVLRFGGSYMAAMFSDWQARLAFSGQYSNTGLVPGEQIGLVGSTAVRGFDERAVTADSGHLANLEAYTPDLAPALSIPGNLRGVLFYDFARGKNIGVVVPTPGTASSVGVAAGGLGLRYNLQKDFSLRADLAEVTKAGPSGTESRGDWRGHFNMSLSF